MSKSLPESTYISTYRPYPCVTFREYQSSSFDEDRFPWKEVELFVQVRFRVDKEREFCIAPPASCPLPASSPTPTEPFPVEKISICSVYWPDPWYWSTQR